MNINNESNIPVITVSKRKGIPSDSLELPQKVAYAAIVSLGFLTLFGLLYTRDANREYARFSKMQSY